MLAKFVLSCIFALLSAELRAADFFSLQLGQSNIDKPASRKNYFNRLRSDFFDAKQRADGYTATLRYGHQVASGSPYYAQHLFFGLGQRQLYLQRSYPAGSLKLERTSYFYELGLSLSNHNYFSPFQFSADIGASYLFSGRTKLSSNLGTQSYEDSFHWPQIYGKPLFFAISGQYRINPLWAIGLTLQGGDKLTDTILLEIDYLRVQADDKH